MLDSSVRGAQCTQIMGSDNVLRMWMIGRMTGRMMPRTPQDAPGRPIVLLFYFMPIRHPASADTKWYAGQGVSCVQKGTLRLNVVKSVKTTLTGRGEVRLVSLVSCRHVFDAGVLVPGLKRVPGGPAKRAATLAREWRIDPAAAGCVAGSSPHRHPGVGWRHPNRRDASPLAPRHSERTYRASVTKVCCPCSIGDRAEEDRSQGA